MALRDRGPETELEGLTLALVFEKPSLRTRVSFHVAMKHLGGDCIYLSPPEVGLGDRETPADVARVLSRYVDCIAARTFQQETVVELARHSNVPVINALSDDEHPCQVLADLLTIREKKGRLAGVTAAFIGDGNNVASSLALGAGLTGLHLRLASPEGYEVPSHILHSASDAASQSGGSVEQTNDPEVAVRDADVVYTDVWASMGQEKEAAVRREDFAGFTVDSTLMSKARGDAIFMHDLPAHRGEEVTDEVMESAQSVAFDQAENRLHAQKALLSLILGHGE
jgi:ornithine carbamoyltransferase